MQVLLFTSNQQPEMRTIYCCTAKWPAKSASYFFHYIFFSFFCFLIFVQLFGSTWAGFPCQYPSQAEPLWKISVKMIQLFLSTQVEIHYYNHKKNSDRVCFGSKNTFSYACERLPKTGGVTSLQNVTVHIRSDKTQGAKSLRVLSELNTLHFLAKLSTPQTTQVQTSWVQLLWRPTQ